MKVQAKCEIGVDKIKHAYKGSTTLLAGFALGAVNRRDRQCRRPHSMITGGDRLFLREQIAVKGSTRTKRSDERYVISLVS